MGIMQYYRLLKFCLFSEFCQTMNTAEEQTLYRLLAEITADYACALGVDASGGLTLEWVSESFTRVTGHTLADVATQGRHSLVHPDDLSRWAERDARALAGEESAEEFRIISRGGERWVQERIRPVWDAAQNRVVRLVVAGWDITARKSAEEARRRHEQDLQFAVGAADLGTFYCEWPFDKIIWNETCKQHFFLPPDADVDFELFYALLHPDDREPAQEAMDRAIEDKTEYNVEYRAQAPDGRIRWINAIGRAQYDAGGIPIRFDGVTRDVTARKGTELELAEAFERETLVNRIGQAIRSAQDPDSILVAAVEALGEALGADRCYYVTYDLELGQGTVEPDWYRAGLESIAGVYDFSIFKFNHDADYLAGKTHVVEDIQAFPGIAPPDCTDLRSLVRAPLAPGRRMTALAVAMSDGPRRWTPNEIMLVEAVASQTQAALETARGRQREHRIATALQEALQPPVSRRHSPAARRRLYPACAG